MSDEPEKPSEPVTRRGILDILNEFPKRTAFDPRKSFIARSFLWAVAMLGLPGMFFLLKPLLKLRYGFVSLPLLLLPSIIALYLLSKYPEELEGVLRGGGGILKLIAGVLLLLIIAFAMTLYACRHGCHP